MEWPTVITDEINEKVMEYFSKDAIKSPQQRLRGACGYAVSVEGRGLCEKYGGIEPEIYRLFGLLFINPELFRVAATLINRTMRSYLTEKEFGEGGMGIFLGAEEAEALLQKDSTGVILADRVIETSDEGIVGKSIVKTATRYKQLYNHFTPLLEGL